MKKQRHIFANKCPYSQNYSFFSSHVWMWMLYQKQGWMMKWCFQIVVLEKSLESLLDCRDRTTVSYRKLTLNIHWKDLWWSWSSNTLTTWCEEQISWKRPWCWERLKAKEEGRNTRWDGKVASLTQWTRLSKLQEIVKERGDWPATVYRISKNQTWPCDWQQEEEFIYLLEVFWLLFSITISNSSVRLSILLNQSWKIM